jgi:hypothetical protein
MNNIEIDLFAAEAAKTKGLNKPFRTPKGPKKFSVYVKNEKGNVVKVNFGDPNMEIKRDDPARRKSYRARHRCETPGPKWKANYWSCKMWSSKPVSKITASDSELKNYMFFQNLKTAKRHIDELLAMDEKMVDAILSDGHDWANDRISTSSDDIMEVHHFLMNREDYPEQDESSAKNKGLWYNIQQKKKRMGKNYRPAKPGDKAYPDQDALKKAQAEEWDGETFAEESDLLKENPLLAFVFEQVDEENCDCEA